MPKVEGTIEIINDDWSRPHCSLEIRAFRTGWPGAWDAIKAAWRRDQRLQVPTDVTFSVYVKKPAEELLIWGAQMEESPGE